MAGLLAARVLAESYRLVTVVDRDVLPTVGVHRRGVPHGRHLHGLHPRGREVLDELFEGFTPSVVADGAVVCDLLRDIRWQMSGHRFAKVHAGLPTLLSSRPFLEGQVRKRLAALPTIRLRERCDVTGLVTTPDRSRVTGARVHDHDSGAEETLSADLVVDATGRGSRLPAWLEQLGYDRPEQDRVEIGVGYATRLFRLRPGALDGDGMVLVGRTPANPRSGVLAALEGGRHLLTLVGCSVIIRRPTPQASGRSPRPSRRRTSPTRSSAPSRWTSRSPSDSRPACGTGTSGCFAFPPGCSPSVTRSVRFNPVYGEGVTVAASEAVTLRRLLAAGREPAPWRYFRAIAKVVDVPWDIAVTGDLAVPGVAGRRTARIRMVNAYLSRLQAAASSDASLTVAFLRVLGLVDRPEGLLRPDRVLLVTRSRPDRQTDRPAAARCAA